MGIRLPLDLLLNQGAVFHHKQVKFEDSARPKFLVYLSHQLFPSPLLFVLSTTDKKRIIPTLSQNLQKDFLVIPPGELDFFKSTDHTFIDLNNHKDISKERFQKDYDDGIIDYVGRLTEDYLSQLIEKAKQSSILRPEIRKRILGQ